MYNTLKTKLISIIVVLVLVIGVNTAYAAPTIVPVASLEPARMI
jgi:hypothetical protein